MSTNPSAMPEKTRTEDLPLISVIVPVYKVERYLDPVSYTHLTLPTIYSV